VSPYRSTTAEAEPAPQAPSRFGLAPSWVGFVFGAARAGEALVRGEVWGGEATLCAILAVLCAYELGCAHLRRV
jgi:hypothetical protein